VTGRPRRPDGSVNLFVRLRRLRLYQPLRPIFVKRPERWPGSSCPPRHGIRRLNRRRPHVEEFVSAAYRLATWHRAAASPAHLAHSPQGSLDAPALGLAAGGATPPVSTLG
jgi:hypothetical protein